MTYIQTTTETYKNIKIVTVNTSTDSRPVAKRKTKVYVDGKIVTGHSRFSSMETVSEAPSNETIWTNEKNF